MASVVPVVVVGFTYWCGGRVSQLRLLQDGCVVYFRDGDEQVAPHGSWYLSDDGDLIVTFDCRGRELSAKVHRFRRLNAFTQAYELVERDGHGIPNSWHTSCMIIRNEETA